MPEPQATSRTDTAIRDAPQLDPALLTTPARAQQQRLLAVDVFRGLTVAAMLLVNNPGNWSAIYPPLQHAAWNGWTPTDLIFPFFLFIAGITTHLSISARIARGDDDALIGRLQAQLLSLKASFHTFLRKHEATRTALRRMSHPHTLSRLQKRERRDLSPQKTTAKNRRARRTLRVDRLERPHPSRTTIRPALAWTLETPATSLRTSIRSVAHA